MKPRRFWGCEWRSRNRLEGKTSHLICWCGRPELFRTKREASEFIMLRYGFILSRKDLRAEPHGWLLPVPVRVTVEYQSAWSMPCGVLE